MRNSLVLESLVLEERAVHACDQMNKGVLCCVGSSTLPVLALSKTIKNISKSHRSLPCYIWMLGLFRFFVEFLLNPLEYARRTWPVWTLARLGHAIGQFIDRAPLLACLSM